MSVDPTTYSIIAGAGAALVALIVGFIAGRRTGDAHARIQDLEARLEVAAKEREFAEASVAAARQEIQRLRTEFEDYRGSVVSHFPGTSGLLRELTVQYRAVYDHLTAGATSLCPEGSVDLLEGLAPESLPEPEPAPAADAAPADDRGAAERDDEPRASGT